MKMTESPVLSLSNVLDDNACVGIPLSHESAISDFSPSLLVTKSNNSTTASPSKSILLYIRYDGMITLVSGAILGGISAVINLELVIVSVLIVSRFRYFTSSILFFYSILLYAILLFIFVNLSYRIVLWAFFKWWHPSALRDMLDAVPSENLGLLGLGCGFLGMQALIVGNIHTSSQLVLLHVLVSFSAVPLMCTHLQYYNNRTMEQANNSQNSGNVKRTDSLVYAQTEIV